MGPLETIMRHLRLQPTGMWAPMLSGTLVALTVPWIEIWWVIFFALIPFFIFVSNTKNNLCKLSIGLLLFWIPYAILSVFPVMDMNGTWWTGTLSYLGEDGLLPTIFFASFMCGIALLQGIFLFPLLYVIHHTPRVWHSAICIATIWTMSEFIRSMIGLMGYGWGVLGHTLITVPYLKHVVILPGGIFLLTFFIIYTNSFIAEIFLNGTSDVPEPSKQNTRLIHTSIFVVLIGVVLVSVLISKQNMQCQRPPIKVSVIAPTIENSKVISEDAYWYYRNLITTALHEGATLIVLPENAFPFMRLSIDANTVVPTRYMDITTSTKLYKDLLLLSKANPETLIALGIHTTSNNKTYNSIVVLQGGIIVATYHKQKLIPLFEYTPTLISLPMIETLTPGTGGHTLLHSPFHISGMICSEVGGVHLFAEKSDIIIVPSNDSVITSPTLAQTHLYYSRTLALRTNAFVLRSSRGGISGIIAPDGTILISGTTGVITTTITPGCY